MASRPLGVRTAALLALLVPCACGSSRNTADAEADAGGSPPVRDAAPPPPLDCGAPDAGGPTLSALVVHSPTDTSLTLVPPFSPATHDYYVQCLGHGGAPAMNELTVSATAGAGDTAVVGIEAAGPSGPAATKQSVSLRVANDQAVVVTAAQGGATEEYWVRCLPDDFPVLAWTPHVGGCARTPGYYLIGTMSLPVGARGPLAQEAAYAIVLDANGVPVWYRYDNTFAAYDVESLTPGHISFSGPWQVDEIGGGSVRPVADDVGGGAPLTPDEHELRVLPNGHYLGFNSATEAVDLTGLTLPNGDGGVMSYGPMTPIYGCYIQEFDATGTVFWQWSATDHFDPVKALVVKGAGPAPTTVEPFHCNAIDVDPVNGNLLISARNMASIFYIDKSTGKVLWKLGGAGADSSFDDPIYVPVDDPFTAQHDARLQPGWVETCAGGSGQISLFDDETYTDNPARGAVYDVRIAGGCGDGGAATAGPTGATLSWQYKNTFDGGVATNVCGSFRISSDGSRVISWGQSEPTPNGLVFTEVDVHGSDLLDLVCPDDSSSYRAVKVPLDTFDLSLLRSSSAEE